MPTIVLSSDQPATVVPFQRTAERPSAIQQAQHQAVTVVPDPVEVPIEDWTDEELLTAVRGGQLSAYGVLFGRHRAAADNLAGQLAGHQAAADDLVAETFLKVLVVLGRGRGPESAFRAYLLTALRHLYYDTTRRARKVELTDCVETTAVGAARAEVVTVPFQDTALAGLEQTLAGRAFARLPERHQAVLWHTEVEDMTPAAVALIMGLTPNGVSALAYRARERLRQAYLQVYVAEANLRPRACRAASARFGAWTRGGLSKRETAHVDRHVKDCPTCCTVVAELREELPRAISRR